MRKNIWVQNAFFFILLNMWAKPSVSWGKKTRDWWDWFPEQKRDVWEDPRLVNADRKDTMRVFVQDHMAKFKDRLGDSRESPGIADLGRLTIADPHAEKVRYLLNDRIGHVASSKYMKQVMTKRSLSASELSKAGRRSVLLHGIPGNTAIGNVVAQIRGGALEKIVYHKTADPCLEVHFLSAAKANLFLKYATETGLFMVNGKHLDVSWAQASREETPSHLPAYIVEEVDYFHASRMLVLSQPVEGKVAKDYRSKRVYPVPEENFSNDFDAESVKWDFHRFGTIVEIMPVISKKLSVSIQFADIRSAVMAKKAFDKKESAFAHKYSAWALKYARDPTNKPCFEV